MRTELRPAPTAFFDVDGTLVEATVVHYYAFLATASMSPARRGLWTLGFLPRVLGYMVLDRISRSLFNRVFYANYRNMDAEETRAKRLRLFEELITPRLYPGALERIEAHRGMNTRIALITGSLDFIIEPLAGHVKADDMLAVQMEERSGRFTGKLTGPPIGDEEKARRLRQYAQERGIDLSASYAYADSVSDLPMLMAVGHPVAVNPGGRLLKTAREKGWEIVRWKR